MNTGEFYGQLVESDFSSFKAQINEQEAIPLPETVPVIQVTSYDLKQNFLQIQQEIESLFKRQGPSPGGTLKPIQAGPIRPEPIAPLPISPSQSNGRANQNGQAIHPGKI